MPPKKAPSKKDMNASGSVSRIYTFRTKFCIVGTDWQPEWKHTRDDWPDQHLRVQGADGTAA